MKNIELLNICYRFFNRFILASELVGELQSINNNVEINKIIEDIEEILKRYPNKTDIFVTETKNASNSINSKLKKIVNDENVDGEIKDKVANIISNNEKEIDSYDRWYKVFEYIINNDYFNESFDNLTDNELLDFVTTYIKAPNPPKLDQEEFDKLVNIGIEKDDREALWRLAFNYDETDLNIDNIVNYYIEKKDGYYLSELISAVDLDVDSIINRINDKELIKELIDKKDIIHLSEEQINKLKDKIY